MPVQYTLLENNSASFDRYYLVAIFTAPRCCWEKERCGFPSNFWRGIRSTRTNRSDRSTIQSMAFSVKENESLAIHTVFKIGGPARFFIEVGTSDDLVAACRTVRSLGVPHILLGAGSNVLVADDGFRGAVIHPAGGVISFFPPNRLRVDASLSMARVAAESLKLGLRGFEWAVGVPGTIGGSVRGNAGCFGGEMKDVVRTVTVFDSGSGEVAEWPSDKGAFRYRSSVFKSHPDLVIIASTLELAPGDREAGASLVREYTLHRSKTQDIGSSSAGCIFKNVPWPVTGAEREALVKRFPELERFRESPNISTGFLIDQTGLKGKQIGRAKISERHGNFFLNLGGAKAEEVIMLVSLAKEKVRQRYGILLEEEIQYVGF